MIPSRHLLPSATGTAFTAAHCLNTVKVHPTASLRTSGNIRDSRIAFPYTSHSNAILTHILSGSFRTFYRASAHTPGPPHAQGETWPRHEWRVWSRLNFDMCIMCQPNQRFLVAEEGGRETSQADLAPIERTVKAVVEGSRCTFCQQFPGALCAAKLFCCKIRTVCTEQRKRTGQHPQHKLHRMPKRLFRPSLKVLKH